MQNSCTLEGFSFATWRMAAVGMGTAVPNSQHGHQACEGVAQRKGSALPPSNLFSPYPLLLYSVIYRCWRNDLWILRWYWRQIYLFCSKTFQPVLRGNQTHLLHHKLQHCWFGPRAAELSQGSVMEVLCDFPQAALVFVPLFHHLVPVCWKLLSQLMASFFSPHIGFL